MPYSGMPGPPLGPAPVSTITESVVIVQLRVVDPVPAGPVAVEDHGGTGVPQQLRLGGDVLDHRTVRGEVAAQHGHAALRGERVVDRPDHVVVVHRRPGELLAEGAAR